MIFMGRISRQPLSSSPAPVYPDETEEARRARLIALAENQAEMQLRAGTAPAPVVVHYLKLATERDRIEKEILERQRDLITAKTEALEQERKSETRYEEVIRALKRYGGQREDDQELY